MNRPFTVLVGLSALTLLATSTAGFAAEPGEPPMHKSEMHHRSDKEAAAQYQDEATQLREKAQSHRTLASQYRARTGGKVSYAQIAAHCDNLAKFYENAAKEADAIASGLAE